MKKSSFGMLNKHHTKESRQKMSKARLGKKFTEEHKQHLSKSKSKQHKQKIGDANRGKKRSKEAKLKYKLNHADFTKEKHPNWKGGEKASQKRIDAKRKEFGFVELNEWFEGCEGHHLDKELVLYIPKKLHQSVRHSVLTGKNIEEINNLACEYVYGVNCL